MRESPAWSCLNLEYLKGILGLEQEEAVLVDFLARLF